MAIDTWRRQIFGYRDVRGNIGKVEFTLGGDSAVLTSETDFRTVADGLATALAACTNAQLVTQSGVRSAPLDPSLYGTSADYAQAETKARLQFLGSSRLRGTTIQIPAPLVNLFYHGGTGDRESIDPTQTPIVNLLAAMQAASNSATVTVGVTTDTIHSLVRGKLIRHKAQRKIGKWSKDPTGVINE